jgi:hypothetical protein
VPSLSRKRPSLRTGSTGKTTGQHPTHLPEATQHLRRRGAQPGYRRVDGNGGAGLRRGRRVSGSKSGGGEGTGAFAFDSPGDDAFPFPFELGEFGFVLGELGAEFEAFGLLLGDEVQQVGVSAAQLV